MNADIIYRDYRQNLRTPRCTEAHRVTQRKGSAGGFSFTSVFLDTDFRLHRCVSAAPFRFISLYFISFFIYFLEGTGNNAQPPAWLAPV